MVKWMKNKTILFVHQNFPAQFKSLAPKLANDKTYEIHTLAAKTDNSIKNPPDYIFYSDASIDTGKHYILNTLAIDQTALDNYNLQLDDTQEASDHLPLVFSKIKKLPCVTIAC